MERILKNYGRYLLLSGRAPELQQAAEEARREALAAQRERSPKELEWERLKNPGFFQKLLGKTAEKQDAAYEAFRQADAAWKAAQRRAEEAQMLWQKNQAELDALSTAPEAYETLKGQPGLAEQAQRALLPGALEAADRLLAALEQTLEKEKSNMGQGRRYEMTEGLSSAKEAAEKLRFLLQQFPEPESWLCDYLRNPDGFVYGVIMQFSPRQQIGAAMSQVWAIKHRLQGL